MGRKLVTPFFVQQQVVLCIVYYLFWISSFLFDMYGMLHIDNYEGKTFAHNGNSRLSSNVFQLMLMYYFCFILSYWQMN